MTTLDLNRVRRKNVPLRVAFLHAPRAHGGPGPLADFVRSRREVALDLLLLAHAFSPAVEFGWIAAPASDWAAGIGLRARPGDRATISRAWSWLEERRLVKTSTQGRIRLVEVLREDKSGLPWTHPSVEADKGVPYFQLPHAYWHGGFARDLSLPAKAMLLIGLSLQRLPEQSGEITGYFEFPLERAAPWYGLTAASAGVGLKQLREIGLLRTWSIQRQRTDQPANVTFDRRHSLNRLEDAAFRRLRN